MPARNTRAMKGMPIQMSTQMQAMKAGRGMPSQVGGLAQMPVALKVALSSPYSGWYTQRQRIELIGTAEAQGTMNSMRANLRPAYFTFSSRAMIMPSSIFTATAMAVQYRERAVICQNSLSVNW